MSHFNFTTMSEYKGKIGTIRLDFDPVRTINGMFGVHKDVDGNKWHFNGWAAGHILAQPLNTTSQHYYATYSGSAFMGPANTPGNSGFISDRWIPYKVEVKEKKDA